MKDNLRFYSVASGSTGNAYIIQSRKKAVILDVGTTGKNIITSLEALHIPTQLVEGILITHEHTDHIKNIRMISKKMENAKVYSTYDTLCAIEDKVEKEKLSPLSKRLKAFEIGDILIEPFKLSHDAVDPVGYSISSGGSKITILTDTGQVKPKMMDHLIDSDLIVLESNYEKNILMMGDYPYFLKQRILSKHGHLSNEDNNEALIEIFKNREDNKKLHIRLAHLSQHNNTPEQAYISCKNALLAEGYKLGREFSLKVLPKNMDEEAITV